MPKAPTLVTVIVLSVMSTGAVRPDLAVAVSLGERDGQLVQAQAVRVPDVRHDQSAWGLRRDAEVHIGLVNDLLRLVLPSRVDLGVAADGEQQRLHGDQQRCDPDVGELAVLPELAQKERWESDPRVASRDSVEYPAGPGAVHRRARSDGLRVAEPGPARPHRQLADHRTAASGTPQRRQSHPPGAPSCPQIPESRQPTRYPVARPGGLDVRRRAPRLAYWCTSGAQSARPYVVEHRRASPAIAAASPDLLPTVR